MDHSQHYDTIGFQAKVHGVRKPANRSPTHIFGPHSEQLRPIRDQIQSGLDTRSKLRPQAIALPFVPIER